MRHCIVTEWQYVKNAYQSLTTNEIVVVKETSVL